MFWVELRIVAKTYLDHRQQMHDLLSQDRKDVPRPSERQAAMEALVHTHGVRIDALNAARDHFGRERFDRFMYHAIARTMAFSGSASPGARIEKEREARGCR